jgi:5-methyltetrahydropteroyltriglutamate--homocysteine methyltransferase
MVFYSTSTLGFGRMGPNRELKFALEKYWKKDIKSSELLSVAREVEESAWTLQVDAGIDRVTVGDFYLYDGVATFANALGIIPSRFMALEPGLDRMFAMCRGIDGAEALSVSCLCLYAVYVDQDVSKYMHFFLYYCHCR